MCPRRIPITAAWRQAPLDHFRQDGGCGRLVVRGRYDPEPEKAEPMFGRVHHCHRSSGHGERIAESHRVESVLAILTKTKVVVGAEWIKG
jgi:hypothetical protein